MRLHLKIILGMSAFLTFHGTALAKNDFLIDPGFKTLKSSDTPDFLRQSTDSVFKILVPASRNVSTGVYTDISGNRAQSLIASIENHPNYIPLRKIAIIEQIQNCQRQGELLRCPLFFEPSYGTAFLAGDGKTLWTNAHVIRPYLDTKAQLEGVSVESLIQNPVNLPIFLFDHRSQIRLNPFQIRATLIRTAPPTELAAHRQSWYAEDSDYVVIQLSEPIGIPLPIASTYQTGETVFRPGFPSCTGCDEGSALTYQDRGQGKNSNGNSYYWTSGDIQPLNTALRFLNIHPQQTQGTRLDQMIFFRADGQAGMSGGPILNRRGEVIGLYSGIKMENTPTGQIQSLCRGVRPHEFSE